MCAPRLHLMSYGRLDHFVDTEGASGASDGGGLKLMSAHIPYPLVVVSVTSHSRLVASVRLAERYADDDEHRAQRQRRRGLEWMDCLS